MISIIVCSRDPKFGDLHRKNIVFIHEDCFFMEPGWGAALYSKFEKDPLLGGVGVAGTQYLFSTTPAWIAAGMPFIRGRVIHELRNGEMFVLTIFSWDKADAEVVAFDGMQIRKTHRLLVTWDIMLKHFSGGNMNQVWLDYGKRFLEKYRSVLPVSCVPAGEIPDPARHRGCQSFDLRGKAPLGVIV